MKLLRHLPTILLVSVFPLGWLLFATLEPLRPFYRDLENMAMDWRFQLRGPLETEIPIIYANIDAETTEAWGERPYARSRYAVFVNELFKSAGVKVVGIDMVLSENVYSDLVDLEKVRASNLLMGQVADQYPNLVLAGHYAVGRLPETLEERARRDKREGRRLFRHFPYLGSGIDPAETYPELPGYPILALDDILAGQVGLINWSTARSAGQTPRFVPLFADARGPYAFLDQLDSYLSFFGIPEDRFGDPPPEASPEQVTAWYSGPYYLQQDEQVVLSAPGQMPTILPIREVDHRFYHFSVELALRYLGLDHRHVSVDNNSLTIRDDAGAIKVRAPLINGQELEINWFSPWHDISEGALIRNRFNPQASVQRIRQHLINLRAEEDDIRRDAEAFLEPFKGAIVLIGPTDPLLQDLGPSPFDREEVPKVGLHGNALKTLLTNAYIHRLQGASGLGLVLATTVLLTGLVAGFGVYSGERSGLARVLSLGFFILYLAAVFLSFRWFHFVLPLVAPAGSAAMAATVGFLYQLSAEERRRTHIKNLFGTYVSSEQVNALVEQGQSPRLGGEQVEITAFFSDVQGFSSFSEALPPERLVALMNEYLGAMTAILQEEKACLDKYIGDAIVAFFNAPVRVEDHALRACRAAAKMQLRQAELRAKWASEGNAWPDMVPRMRTRIGLNTGLATVGNMGSVQRLAYTMMGDTVNLAARCESGAKTAGTYTLITRSTMEQATALSDEVVFRFVDRWQVKGREQPVDMFEIVGLRTMLDEDSLRCVETYEAALQAYFEQDFVRASTLFAEAQIIEPMQPGRDDGVANNPSIVMLERCQAYAKAPPGKGWDGVFVMRTK